MKYTVKIENDALEQLSALTEFISHQSTPNTALSISNKILEHAQSLELFPHRGTQRHYVREGLRTINYRKRVVIAFTVNDDDMAVSVIGFFYGGRDWETILGS